MDAVFRNTLNTTDVPSYTVLSAMAAKDVNRHLTLRLNANNLGRRPIRRSRRRRPFHPRRGTLGRR